MTPILGYGSPFPAPQGWYPRLGKRVLDLAIALPAALVLSPVIAGVGFAVRARLGAPILFWQERPGLDTRSFRLVKFRTMRTTDGSHGRPLPDADRLTRLGRWLRSTSLDELPELWNVVRGEMSLVGPRPLLPRYLPRYTPQQHRRHHVRPGLTGWAQIHGRNAIAWEQKFELDAWYVDHVSLALDLKILARTAITMIRREGIHQAGHATMEEFWGTAS